MMPLSLVMQLAVLILLARISWTDWVERRIPNVLLIAVLALALGHLVLTGQLLFGREGQWGQLLWSMVLVALLTLPGMALKQLGAGDVKLLWVFCLLMGLGQLMLVCVLGLLALVISAFWIKRRPLPLAPYVSVVVLLLWLGGA
ncbi:prepilin peptidase [Pokkaliibacter sp. CJK22405]|uniref:prepilin peptidase n=1 Tax=Pokkaliibacter sp. CJK22405 TaxID=3384615 RepID=UPI003984739E